MTLLDMIQEILCLIIDILVVVLTFVIDTLNWIETIINPDLARVRFILRDYDPERDDIPAEEQ